MPDEGVDHKRLHHCYNCLQQKHGTVLLWTITQHISVVSQSLLKVWVAADASCEKTLVCLHWLK